MRRRETWARQIAVVVLFALSLGAVYGSTLAEHVKSATRTAWFHDDARNQIPPMYRWADRELGRGDYLGDYQIAHLPVGYAALFWCASFLWDAEVVSRVLPYILLLMTIVALALAAHRIAGLCAAWAAVALCLGASTYLERVCGGMARGFAFPLLACALAALVLGKLRWAAWLTVIGAAFYPMTAVTMGLALAAALLLLPNADRGEAEGWPLRRRFTLLAITAVLTVLISLPPLLESRGYGPVVTQADWVKYPEASPSGMLEPQDLPPYASFMETALSVTRSSVFGAGRPWVDWFHGDERSSLLAEVLCVLVLAGWLSLVRSPPARRLVAFAIGAFASHMLALLLQPHLYAPSRYVHYPLPPLAEVAIPAGIALFARNQVFAWMPKPWMRTAGGWIGCVLFSIFVGGRGDPLAGYTVRLDDHQASFYVRIAELPKNVLIAGWPDDAMSNLPYLSKRHAWLTGELMVPFPSVNTGYLEEMRRRMQLFVDAYFATSIEPLVKLRDEGGVTHLLLDLRHLDGSTPGYAQPMGSWVALAVARARGQNYEVIRQIENASVIQDRPFVLLDLSRIQATKGGAEPNELHPGADVMISNAYSGGCISGKAERRGAIRIASCDPHDVDQIFRFERSEDGTAVKLSKTNPKRERFCIDVLDRSPALGALLVMEPCEAVKSQSLQVEPLPTRVSRISLPFSGLVFDQRTDGSGIQQFRQHGGGNQSWTFRYEIPR
jgi:hypothetical protein